MTITLDLNCRQCGGAVWVHFESMVEEDIREPGWTCPHCLARNTLSAIGRVTGVTKRGEE